MTELRWVVEYIDSIDIGKEFTLYDIMEYHHIMHSNDNSNNIYYILNWFENINIVYYNRQAPLSISYLKKLKNIPFSQYLTYQDLVMMVKDNNYIKTFERKCKLKLLKNERI